MLYEIHKQLECRLIGQKALSLSELQGGGFLIPRSLVLSTVAFERFLRFNDLWEKAQAGGDRQLSGLILRGDWPPEFEAVFHRILTHFGAPMVVRSSAVDEDGHSKSFAGQYESVLGVMGINDLKDAILTCWSSYYSHRVLLYRGAQHAPPAGMALLLQDQIQPRFAGVCFSINPMTGAWDELIIEAIPGLGEKVVSGSVLPDYYALERPKRILPIGLRLQLRKPPKVLEAVIPSQQRIPHSILSRLWRIALRLERQFRQAQDIEWAYSDGQLYLLQHRPITTQPKASPQETLWSQAFIGERWNTPAYPLAWSLFSKQLAHLIEYPQTARLFYGGDRSLRLHAHAPYLNLTPFRQLIFKWPGAKPPSFMLELLPEAEARQLKQRFFLWPNFSFYLSILRETHQEKRWRRFSWNPLVNWLDWEAFEKEMNQVVKAEGRLTNLAELWMRHQEYSKLSQRYIGIHICSLLFANIGYQFAFWRLGASLSVAQRHLVLRSHRTSPTTLTNQALWKLANGHLSLEAFLDEYGHRAPNSWEMFSDRWVEDPEQLSILMGLLVNQPEPLIHEAESLEASHNILASLPVRQQILVRGVQRYLYLREAQRFAFDQLLLSWKRLLLQISEQLNLDVRWLTEEELENIVHTEIVGQSVDTKWKPLIRHRENEWLEASQAWLNGQRPPFVLRSDEPIWEEHHRQYRGIGISPGTVKGRARVLHAITEAHQLQPGEILVVRSTDPAWTPLFVPAAGVVMELGGMLSHGAIVARECGTPAISGIEGITSAITTGDMIEIDGRRGSLVVCS